MFKRLKGLFKSRDEKELDTATENFDELMGKVNEDQQDLSHLEHHIREEWDEIHDDMDEMTEEVDKAIKKEPVKTG